MVSCADILTNDVRDATILAGRPFWEATFGRKDRKISLASEANFIPHGHENIIVLLQFFEARGLNILDLVALSSSHTIGRSTCYSFIDRLQVCSSSSFQRIRQILTITKTWLPVILKIIKHCKDHSPSLVTGQLLGLDVGSVLEVTNCFPFPMREEDEEVEADGANYQLEMMRCLREVNVDNNTVGWYQSTLLGSFQTVELIETFMNYQENIRRCVCIIYDPSRSDQGVLALKALKLSDSFMELYRNNNFTGEKCGFSSRGCCFMLILFLIYLYQIKVSNSALISAFMTELEPDTPVTQFQFYYRNLSRQQAQQQAWLQKRRTENLARKATGEEPLPEEDPANPIFKPHPEPSRLESFLITNQISNYCNQINGVSGQSFNRLYLMKALHED
ncbi:hypothetical protein TanjilG_12227 [Lupinus angustifolius]|uniref:Eukaryotic translation initiation factor 3 subunit H n=1 Tax=Lupinus angustifolius TaxID=3871 RepID=A0A1J7HGE0_LUPAN|nr:hypothetical protein TanjilG_12227 [Lupinus angustifolius]